MCGGFVWCVEGGGGIMCGGFVWRVGGGTEPNSKSTTQKRGRQFEWKLPVRIFQLQSHHRGIFAFGCMPLILFRRMAMVTCPLVSMHIVHAVHTFLHWKTKNHNHHHHHHHQHPHHHHHYHHSLSFSLSVKYIYIYIYIYVFLFIYVYGTRGPGPSTWVKSDKKGVGRQVLNKSIFQKPKSMFENWKIQISEFLISQFWHDWNLKILMCQSFLWAPPSHFGRSDPIGSSRIRSNRNYMFSS